MTTNDPYSAERVRAWAAQQYPSGTPLDQDRRMVAAETEAYLSGRTGREASELSQAAKHAGPIDPPAAQKPTDAGQISDGYHTFEELYEYRMLYNAHAATGWLAASYPVVKSWRHSDGELCFGGGWFIVTAELPSGQVSNHYAAEHWELFDVPEVDLPPAYDGHTPQEAARRLREARAARRDEEKRDG